MNGLKTEHWPLKNGSSKKIEKEATSSIGFGPDKPVGDNETEEGRKKIGGRMLYRMNVTDDETDRTDGKDKMHENSEIQRDKESDTTK